MEAYPARLKLKRSLDVCHVTRDSSTTSITDRRENNRRFVVDAKTMKQSCRAELIDRVKSVTHTRGFAVLWLESLSVSQNIIK